MSEPRHLDHRLLDQFVAEFSAKQAAYDTPAAVADRAAMKRDADRAWERAIRASENYVTTRRAWQVARSSHARAPRRASHRTAVRTGAVSSAGSGADGPPAPPLRASASSAPRGAP